MRSPQTIGDELPRPGTVTFQRPLLAFQVSVYGPGDARPWPDGPRQRDQYFAASPVASSIRTSAGAANTAAVAATITPRASRRFIGSLCVQCADAHSNSGRG